MEKTLGRIYKETLQKDIKKEIKDKPNFFIARYKGLKSPEVCELRKELSKYKVKVSVVRNKLTRAVLEEMKLKDLTDAIDDPTALIFSSEDPVGVSKSLMAFAKDHENLKVAFAYIDNQILDSAKVKELSMLPSREVLLSRVVGGIKSPLNGLANVLSGTLRKLVGVFDAIAKSKTN
jgi:large subunit ribosomal protein L10